MSLQSLQVAKTLLCIYFHNSLSAIHLKICLIQNSWFVLCGDSVAIVNSNQMAEGFHPQDEQKLPEVPYYAHFMGPSPSKNTSFVYVK
jgi:hypothetical protein